MPKLQCTTENQEKNESNKSSNFEDKSLGCNFTEYCVSNCKEKENICPCAARAAGKAARSAVNKLYKDSEFFTKEVDFQKFSDWDNLKITTKLGEGGFSVVYAVKQLIASEETDRVFAVKHLKRKILIDRTSFRRGAKDLAIEATFLANLNHSHIVKIHGIPSGSIEANISSGKECGFFIVIDQLCFTLDKVIKRWKTDSNENQVSVLSRRSHSFKENRKFALMDRLKIASQITDAMGYLHHQNIIYRDLKPTNIGFDNNGQVKLFDFGLAKEFKKKFSEKSRKLTGRTGTLRYMAPEVAKEEHYNHLVDVYSFGVLLYELSSLKTPFHGHDASKHMERVVFGGERPPLSSNELSWFPNELRVIINNCWSPNISQRPSFDTTKMSIDRIIHDNSLMKPRFHTAREFLLPLLKKRKNTLRRGSGIPV